MNKDELMMLSAVVWKYGEVFIDDNEIEHHIIKLTHEEFLEFGWQTLEVYHDKEDKISYYRVKRTT